MTSTSATVDLIYCNAGGGHRAAAQALREAIEAGPLPWNVRCVDLFDLLDPARQFQRVMGFAPEEVYNKRLARGWTLGLAQELKLLQGMIRLAHKQILRRLAAHWLRGEPDLVVSLIPNFNLALQESLAQTLPGVPFVTVLTDMADHPPSFWMEAPRGQHIVCGTGRAVEQATAMGHPASRVHRSSGMIMRPDFHAPMQFDRAAEMERLGLDPARPTAVVMFGGQGSMSMLRIERDLQDVQLVLMCGHNLKLATRLRQQKAAAPRAVVGFTPDVRRHLQLADVFIGKPGPGCLSEAVHLGLPVVTTRNAWTMPQERFNAEWVTHNGLGVVASSLRKIRPALLDVLQRLGEFQTNVARVENNAVFEVPRILARILDASAGDLAQPGFDDILMSHAGATMR
jgi:UDP-N-acetylglucosamine:LPS N-acetylglucosamine transferase